MDCDTCRNRGDCKEKEEIAMMDKQIRDLFLTCECSGYVPDPEAGKSVKEVLLRRLQEA